MRELCLPKDLPVTVPIFRQRPKLEETISGILAAIHSGKELPEKIKELVYRTLAKAKRLRLNNVVLATYAVNEPIALARSTLYSLLGCSRTSKRA